MSSLSFTVTGDAETVTSQQMPALVMEKVASRIFAQDPTLWGPDAESEASIRLGWVAAPEISLPLVPQIVALREELLAEGVDHIVLAGMGGSSLAPEVITATAGVALTVLDSTDPDQVRDALADRLERTAVVVASKSGSTVETDSQRRAFSAAFTAAGIDAASRMIVVTDPGSPLEALAKDAGYRAVFTADPHVGGRYSALTAFGLVPSGLAGVDVAALLAEAEEAAETLREDSFDNLGLAFGAALGGPESGTSQEAQSEPSKAQSGPSKALRNKPVIVDEGSGIIGFAEWAEQLIAESTGKLGTGLLPVVADPQAPELDWNAPDILVIRLVSPDTDNDSNPDQASPGQNAASQNAASPSNQVVLSGGLAAQMMLWEFATAVAGRLLGINPFDQPDVEAAKVAARGLLDAQPSPEAPRFSDGVIEVRAGEWLGSEVTTAEEAVAALLAQLPADGYLSIQAYFDRIRYASFADSRDTLAAASRRPTTFGWGPRFLHSTGQFHKGGPAIGVFLQITAAPEGSDVTIPERPFSFGELITAQAAGDAQVLSDHGRPVLRLHLTDRAAGVRQLTELFTKLPQVTEPDPGA